MEYFENNFTTRVFALNRPNMSDLLQREVFVERTDKSLNMSAWLKVNHELLTLKFEYDC